jgi:uncharacterized membrane protein YphA (DoxX/SURF4 family)
MTKIIASLVVALGVLTAAASANAAPVMSPSDIAVHGYLGNVYGK